MTGTILAILISIYLTVGLCVASFICLVAYAFRLPVSLVHFLVAMVAWPMVLREPRR